MQKLDTKKIIFDVLTAFALSFWYFCTINQGSMLWPVGSSMRPGFTQWRLNFHALVANLASKIGGFLLWENVH